VNRVGELAEQEGHHPDIHIHWNRVTRETSMNFHVYSMKLPMHIFELRIGDMSIDLRRRKIFMTQKLLDRP